MKSLCHRCPAACCRYIALPFDEPKSAEAFEEIRWFLMHEGVTVFVTDGQWYVSMQTHCRHLDAQSRCTIYARRPLICRQYSSDGCDYRGGDYGYKLFFTHPEQIAEYARTHGRKRKGKVGGKTGSEHKDHKEHKAHKEKRGGS
jgi:uncharacterized protein